MKKILSIAMTFLAAAGLAGPSAASISGTWRIHPTFDNSVTTLVDSPDYVYFTGLVQSVNSSVDFRTDVDNAIFRYDKEGDEIIGLSKSTGLSSSSVKNIVYNGYSGYLLVIYSDYNIDLVTDSGEVRNISALKSASIPGSKAINSVSFYPKEHQAVLATDFGYIILDDEKAEIKESRNYNQKIDAAARFGDRILLSYNGATYVAPYSERRMSLSDYTRFAAAPKVSEFVEMGDKDELLLAVAAGSGAKGYVLSSPGPEMRVHTTHDLGTHLLSSRGKNGVTLVTNWGTSRYLTYDNKISHFFRPEGDSGLPVGSWDGVQYYVANPRKGLRCYKVDLDEHSMTVTKDFAMPNAPNVFWSRAMAYHPRHGLLVNNYGLESCFNSSLLKDPILLSGYKNGLWTSLGNVYRNPRYEWAGFGPTGLLIDPDDDRYIYTASYFSGILRTNLDDPADILNMTHPADETSSLPGYVKLADDIASWKRLCRFTAPTMDSQGTVWSHYSTFGGDAELWYWTAEDRRASKDAASFRPWHKISLPNFQSSSHDRLLALTHPSNRGILVGSSNNPGRPILVYDTNGTPGVTSDDSRVIMTGITDQDGGVVDTYNVHCIFEDQQSGAVWLGCAGGIFYFQPRQALAGQHVLNRVKVARNDGTSLADYLLNGITVTDISLDNLGRKWISTLGGGVVVTSADGRNVLAEFTESNSGLPSDEIYLTCYNPENHSMMISTSNGLTEFVLSGGDTSGDSSSEVRAYPNPVAPDYYGWVTVDGLPDNAHVKIVDSEGNLVRELGLAEGGATQWDVLNIYGKRVRTGVYYVLTSTSSGEANVAKILVMN